MNMKQGSFVLLFSLFTSSLASAQLVVTDENRFRMSEVVSVFENSTEVLQYAYIEALNDGRGYTAGRMGATTGTGDLLEIVEEYLKINPTSDFAPLLPVLKERAKTNSGSIKDLESLPKIWVAACNDPQFKTVQDNVDNWMYFQPALKIANEQKITSQLGMLIFYDTIIEHGEEGVDGLDYIIKHMKTDALNEEQYLTNFLKERRYVLLHPHDPTTVEAWKESVGRVDALSKLLKEKNLDLVGAFSIDPFGDNFVIR